MICCGKKKLPGYKLTSLYVLSHRFRFSTEELVNQQHRFERMSENGIVSIDSFSLQLGSLGNKSISNRIFKAMNISGSGQVTFEEYLEYMDILIHGTEDQKAKQSFNLIKQKNSDVITKKEFNYWLVEMLKFYNVVTGKEINTSHEALEKYFEIIDVKKDGVIDFDEYKITMNEKKEIFNFFNVISDGLEKELQPVQVQEQPDYLKRLESVEEQLRNCIQLMQRQQNRGPMSLLPPAPEHLGDDSVRSVNSLDFESIISMADDSLSEAEVIPDCIKLTEKLYNEGGSDFGVLSMLKELEEKLFSIRKGLKKEKSMSGKINLYKPPKVNKGNIQWGDEDWNLILNMMLGIQKAVQVTSQELPGYPQPEEFERKAKHNLLLAGRSSKREVCQFKDYCPSIFLRIRKLYNISNESYLDSLGVIKLMNSLFKGEFSSLIGLVSAGKSGCFFYHSSDGQYMLKTMTRKDYLFLKKILPSYYAHMLQNPNTLLVRYFGFHKILYKKGREFIKQYFVVMGNVFKSPLEVHMSYDLKGSTHGRSTDETEDFSVPRKDVDFNQSGLKINLGELKEGFIKQLEDDCQFLRDNSINDYSLLLGIHNKKGEIYQNFEVTDRVFERDYGGISSDDGKFVYFFGIIDILTVYNFTKKLEHLVKSQLYGNTVSCVPPDQYAERFLLYLKSVIN